MRTSSARFSLSPASRAASFSFSCPATSARKRAEAAAAAALRAASCGGGRETRCKRKVGRAWLQASLLAGSARRTCLPGYLLIKPPMAPCHCRQPADSQSHPTPHLLGQRLLLLPELALNDLLVHPALEGRALRGVRRLSVLQQKEQGRAGRRPG